MNSESNTPSKGQWMALAAAILGWLFDGFEMGLFPVVMKPLLKDLLEFLKATPDFSAAALDAAIHAWMESRGLQMGQLVHALRLALTGKTAGPGLFDCLELLGRERANHRIELAIKRA